MAAPCCTAPLGAGPGGGGEGAAGPMEAAAAGGAPAPAPAPSEALRAVLKPSGALPAGSLPVRGYDFAGGPDLAALLRSFLTTGFQATSFGQAVAEIRRMVGKKGGGGSTGDPPGPHRGLTGPPRCPPLRSRRSWSR